MLLCFEDDGVSEKSNSHILVHHDSEGFLTQYIPSEFFLLLY